MRYAIQIQRSEIVEWLTCAPADLFDIVQHLRGNGWIYEIFVLNLPK